MPFRSVLEVDRASGHDGRAGHGDRRPAAGGADRRRLSAAPILRLSVPPRGEDGPAEMLCSGCSSVCVIAFDEPFTLSLRRIAVQHRGCRA
jgi:hypothetical protein